MVVVQVTPGGHNGTCIQTVGHGVVVTVVAVAVVAVAVEAVIAVILLVVMVNVKVFVVVLLVIVYVVPVVSVAVAVEGVVVDVVVVEGKRNQRSGRRNKIAKQQQQYRGRHANLVRVGTTSKLPAPSPTYLHSVTCSHRPPGTNPKTASSW